MGNFDALLSFLPRGSDVSASRRRVLLAPLVAAVTLAMARTAAQAGRIDPTQTIIILPDAMKWVPWSGAVRDLVGEQRRRLRPGRQGPGSGRGVRQTRCADTTPTMASRRAPRLRR